MVNDDILVSDDCQLSIDSFVVGQQKRSLHHWNSEQDVRTWLPLWLEKLEKLEKLEYAMFLGNELEKLEKHVFYTEIELEKLDFYF